MSLCAKPEYNHVLISAINVSVDDGVDLCIFHLLGIDNIIAGPLSCYRNELTLKLAPHLTISTFIPPQDALGDPKK
jgi:hypothetical protein